MTRITFSFLEPLTSPSEGDAARSRPDHPRRWFVRSSVEGIERHFESSVNGWYKWSPYTNEAETDINGRNAKCATFAPPLCYPGVCEASANVKPTIDVFVKRLPASIGDADKASNVWLTAGGPGAPSSGMEYLMEMLHGRLEGAVNVYTMDFCGIGRSTLLYCIASQAMTSGSPSSITVDPSKVPACARELHNKDGDLASFPATSAAVEISTFISEYKNGASTIMYGVSYGKIVLRRLMHFNPSNVTGCVLDSIATVSVAPDERAYFTNMDAAYGGVGERFMALCEQENDCGSHSRATNMSATLRNVLSELTATPTWPVLLSFAIRQGFNHPVVFDEGWAIF